MDGEIYGPYSAKGMLDLGVLPDIMVTEISLNVWQTADNFNFQDLAKKEMLEKLKATAATDEVASSPNIEEKEICPEESSNESGTKHSTATSPNNANSAVPFEY